MFDLRLRLFESNFHSGAQQNRFIWLVGLFFLASSPLIRTKIEIKCIPIRYQWIMCSNQIDRVSLVAWLKCTHTLILRELVPIRWTFDAKIPMNIRWTTIIEKPRIHLNTIQIKYVCKSIFWLLFANMMTKLLSQFYARVNFYREYKNRNNIVAEFYSRMYRNGSVQPLFLLINLIMDQFSRRRYFRNDTNLMNKLIFFF